MEILLNVLMPLTLSCSPFILDYIMLSFFEHFAFVYHIPLVLQLRLSLSTTILLNSCSKLASLDS